MKKVSIKSIAEELGVSKTTVSFVLNGKGDENKISETTQKKIIDIAREKNYQPNQLARSLVIGKSHTIGLIIPDISNPFFGKMGKFIEHYIHKKGFNVMFGSTMESAEIEKKLLDVFFSRQVDGIIIAATMKNKTLPELFIKNNYPVVFFDRIPSERNLFSVSIDDESATNKLTKRLILKGHKSIGLISLLSHLPNISSRVSGYKRALLEEGIEFNENLIYDINLDNKKEDVKEALCEMMESKNSVTAVIFLNNMLAAEGIWCLNVHLKDRIGKLDLACFDNLDMFDYSSPSVTSVIQPVEEIAKQCVNMLFNQIEGNEIENRVILQTKIIDR